MRALLIPANPTRRVTTITLDPHQPETALAAHLGNSLTSLCHRTGPTRLQIWPGPTPPPPTPAPTPSSTRSQAQRMLRRR
ncbi:hypothetical protein [Kocuria marina]|uniref:hypothetical protein n=1 Tax=Kocuria marina TaxID=223184 RepID=UPI00117B915B